MKNPTDYEAGWTGSVLNPKTNKSCSGGAARNLRLAQQGGVAAVESKAVLQTLIHLQPVIESLQAQLEKSQSLNAQFAEIITANSKQNRKS